MKSDEVAAHGSFSVAELGFGIGSKPAFESQTKDAQPLSQNVLTMKVGLIFEWWRGSLKPV